MMFLVIILVYWLHKRNQEIHWGEFYFLCAYQNSLLSNCLERSGQSRFRCSLL